MRVKRYVVDTMPDAMHSIRSELGSDAVILSTKEIKIGGFMGLFTKKKIEVVAAVEKEQKAIVPEKRPTPSLSVPRSAVPQAYQKASANALAFADKPAENRTFAEIAAALSEAVGIQSSVAVLSEPTLEETHATASNLQQSAPSKESLAFTQALHESLGLEPVPAVATGPENDVLREIRDMKQWMERIARHSSVTRDLPSRLEQLRDRLIEQETDTVLVEEWVETVVERWNEDGRTWIPEQFDECLREQLDKFLSNRIGYGIASDTRIVYIAGPTGVGKTTTIAKLAAEQLFRQGRKVGLITSDTYRISAVEQLRTYAAILNIPLEVVQSPGDLQRALFRLESCDLVLMDTAGRNYRNEMLVAELQSLLAKELKSETFLVLSLTSKSRDMKMIAEHFGRYQLDKVIFTKLDETGSYGPLFNVLNDYPLALSYVTNGQNVPDDLLMVSKEQLCDLLLGTGGP
ncbi:flagellar biosynthesis protein FlhF [Paenibacillus monticola]|uniref:Flagellar biosynthesis protein FlhF n=1 Tax=Paenibacillus monticola TaxID=2666075 RepID=A0A7X2L2W4_9BACL|nr:flagellar biosynthesis protein FlhF [Paenibacillus monticola]MRN54849.1 flagellar biosynthesis protein FlhF [Paenibacillus monticola]